MNQLLVESSRDPDKIINLLSKDYYVIKCLGDLKRLYKDDLEFVTKLRYDLSKDLSIENYKEINPYLYIYEVYWNNWMGRDLLTKLYSWAVPNEEVINKITEFSNKSILEVGAGSGYWARLLHKKGCNIKCCDDRSDGNYLRGWYPVLKMEGSDFVEKYKDSDRVLMLCWPYSSNLYGYKGKKIIYIGEGSDGCTGTLLDTLDIKTREYVSIPEYR